MRNSESVLMTWAFVATAGMFISVGGMHKLDLWGPSAACSLVLASHVLAFFTACWVADRD